MTNKFKKALKMAKAAEVIKTVMAEPECI